MQARLIVKNFGPIEDVDLDLRNVNVFIGPQASGKSALAKIYTICKSPLSFYDDGTNKNLVGLNGKISNVDRFKKILEDYNVGSFLNDDTYIFFSSDVHDFSYTKDGIVYDRKIFKEVNELEKYSENIEETRIIINSILCELYEKFIFFAIYLDSVFNIKKYLNQQELSIFLSKNKINIEQLKTTIEKLKAIENDISTSMALYVPAERNFITIIKGASLNLLNNNVPIPKHILTFGAEFEKASYEKKELSLSFLKKGLVYKNEDGIDKIYYTENTSIRLTEAASGLQSIVPLLLPIISKREANKFIHKSYVIEEPELNLFPKAQYELIKVLETDRFDAFSPIQDIGTIHTYTTHSPYILSAFNNLLYANKVKKVLTKRFVIEHKEIDPDIVAFAKVRNVLPVDINPEYFSAYQICDGKAESIFDREKGLIEDNYIDQVTDTMGDDFDALMELMEQE